jgi:hypothetical protein
MTSTTGKSKAKDIDLNTVNDLINFKLDSVKDEMKEEMAKQMQGLTSVLANSSKELQGFHADMAAGIERKIDDGVAHALAAAKEDRAWYMKPTVQIAAGVTVAAAAGYFIYSNRQKSKAALSMAGNNTKFLSSLGAESTEDGIALLNVSKIGR